ncbi:MAG TPA: DUF3137 domain-containing protein [Caulobacteraceae bacterium]|jgi:hypothetical protein
MSAVSDTLATSAAVSDASFGHRLAPPGDPLEGASFDALYATSIEPELVKREAERRGAVQLFVAAAAVAAVAAAAEIILRLGSPPLLLPTVVIILYFGYLPLAAVGSRAKVGVIEALCGPLNISYQPKGTDAPSFATFQAFNLLPHCSDKAFSDFFSGRRGETQFDTCHASLHQGSGKNRHLVFAGQLFCLARPRRLASQTVVLRNSGWMNRFECPHGLKAVGLEDPVFNKAFAVFGSDQVEAREILTPDFMQQLDELERVYAGGHIRCAFDETQLLIALEGPDRFQIGGMFSSLVQRARVEAIARNLEQVFKLIDEFKDA